ncbi:vitrin [Sorex araneus]|uniref:vitrin n=1 Tax=Sorex araneus TaxID=42254 RepID=UPI0024334602|nr:vitrin [Sorex araneus]
MAGGICSTRAQGPEQSGHFSWLQFVKQKNRRGKEHILPGWWTVFESQSPQTRSLTPEHSAESITGTRLPGLSWPGPREAEAAGACRGHRNLPGSASFSIQGRGTQRGGSDTQAARPRAQGWTEAKRASTTRYGHPQGTRQEPHAGPEGAPEDPNSCEAPSPVLTADRLIVGWSPLGTLCRGDWDPPRPHCRDAQPWTREGLAVLTMKAAALETLLVLLVTGIHSNKEVPKKSKRPKFTAPQISCAVTAGDILEPEFVVRCPAGCGDPQYRVRGSGPYAAPSSVCGAAVLSGVLPGSGGKVLVRKVLGESDSEGGYPGGAHAPSLPLQRGLFTVSEVKPQEGATYPSALTFSSPVSSRAGEATGSPQRPVPGATAPPAALMQVAPAGQRSPAQGDMDTWKPGSVLLDAGFVPEEPSTPPTEPAAQGDPSCRVDLAFLVDGSSSLGKRRFRIQTQFLAEMARVLDIGPAGPLMGVVQYGDTPALQFSLKAHSSSRDVQAAVEKMVPRGGLANAGRAISFVTRSFFSKANGNRAGAPNVAVVLVDGWPSDRVEDAARLAREAGINVFLLTVEGPLESERELVLEPDFAHKAACRPNGFYALPVASWGALGRSLQPLARRVCDAERLVCSRTCLNSADVGFVLDGSSSVGSGNFRTLLRFAANVSQAFRISAAGARVGAVQYTYEQRLEFGLDAHRSKAAVLRALAGLGYWSGGTSTGAAIRFALQRLFHEARPGRRKLMVLVTDGRSYDDVRAPALAAHRKGVTVYAVGVAWAAREELEIIASHPARDHVFFVEEFDHLHTLVPQILHNICAEFNAHPQD